MRPITWFVFLFVAVSAVPAGIVSSDFDELDSLTPAPTSDSPTSPQSSTVPPEEPVPTTTLPVPTTTTTVPPASTTTVPTPATTEPSGPTTTEPSPTTTAPAEPTTTVGEPVPTVTPAEPSSGSGEKIEIWAGCEVNHAIGPWSAGKGVKCLQSRLIDLGYSAVGVTGVWDRPTKRGVKNFQSSVGLLRRAEANPYTLWKMGIWDGARPPFPCDVSHAIGPWSAGKGVKCVQSRLIDLGYSAVGVTGGWDRPTKRGVKKFQSSVGLLRRAEANPYTLWKMGIWDGARPPFPCDVSHAIGPWSAGKGVKCVQSRLIDLGYSAVGVTGGWDRATKRGVKKFQRARGLLTLVGAGSATLHRMRIWSRDAHAPILVGTAKVASTPSIRSVGRRQVALTFDDGPWFPYSDQIISILNRYEVPATFFVLGAQVSGGAGSVRRAAAAGHSIQNHTWNHAAMTKLSDAGITATLRWTSSAVKSVTGQRTTCYRPPGGSSSARVVRTAAAANMSPEVLWDVDPSDYLRPPPYVLISHVLSRADGRGLNIVLHDGGGFRGNTVAALETIIQGLRARNYRFVSLCN